MKKVVVFMTIVVIFVLMDHAVADAPSPIATAWTHQTALGYTPCKPVISPLPKSRVDENVLADADNGEQSGKCEIRIAWNLSNEDLEWVAWHEVCHLSTWQEIYILSTVAMIDPAHTHYLFIECLDLGPTERGGY